MHKYICLLKQICNEVGLDESDISLSFRITNPTRLIKCGDSMAKHEVDTVNLEEGRKFIENELKSCVDAEYVLSTIPYMNNQKEILIPVILLREKLKKKHEYLDVTMHSKWTAVNGDMNQHEAWMFLKIDFENAGILKFKFNLFDANIRKWVETLILTNGNAVLCDRNDGTNFDVGLSNIPLDIPLAQMTLTAFYLARKRYAVGG
jgi:hypothetical protein